MVTHVSLHKMITRFKYIDATYTGTGIVPDADSENQ